MVFGVFAGNVQAIHDIWIIGDTFLRQMYPTLQDIKTSAVFKKKTAPYMYEQYNVFCYYPTAVNRLMDNALAGTLNALVTILNKRERLPRYIVVVTDQNIVQTADHYDFGVKRNFTKLVKWLATQISRCIQSRKEDLKTKKPGALTSSPRILWVKTIDRPMIDRHPDRKRNQVQSVRTKFNTALENVLAEDTNLHNHIIELTYLSKKAHFTPLGDLNPDGKAHYWKELDHIFKRFDRGEIELLPQYTADEPEHAGPDDNTRKICEY